MAGVGLAAQSEPRSYGLPDFHARHGDAIAVYVIESLVTIRRYLMVEPRRHVAELGDLVPDEAASFGQLPTSASAALREAIGAEHIYAAIIGHGIEHLHLHLIPRYPGTPREYWWTRVDEWPDAPRGPDWD